MYNKVYFLTFITKRFQFPLWHGSFKAVSRVKCFWLNVILIKIKKMDYAFTKDAVFFQHHNNNNIDFVYTYKNYFHLRKSQAN